MKNVGSFTQVPAQFHRDLELVRQLQDGLVKAGEVISTFREFSNRRNVILERVVNASAKLE
jgi:hypothetical protein